MKKLWFVVLGSLLGFWLSTGVHAETTHKSIHELPNIVYMDNETIPHGYEEYLYYPFRLAADPQLQKNGQPWARDLSDPNPNYDFRKYNTWDIISYRNPIGDEVKLIATKEGRMIYHGLDNKKETVPYEFENGAFKWLVNDQSQFKGYMTFADIDRWERVKIKKSNIHKIAIPRNSDINVEISEDGERYRFYTLNGGYDIDDPRAFFTFFFNDLSSDSIEARGGRTVDFSTRTTWKEPEKTGVAVVRYLDENGNDFSWSRAVLTGEIGENFSISEKKFDNYDLIKKPSTLTGIFENIKPLEFIFSYLPHIDLDVLETLTWERNNPNKPINIPINLVGDIAKLEISGISWDASNIQGLNYDHEKKAIVGVPTSPIGNYKITVSIKDRHGQIKEKDLILTLIYGPAKTQLKYLDAETQQEIANETIYNGKVGETYTLEIKNIQNYDIISDENTTNPTKTFQNDEPLSLSVSYKRQEGNIKINYLTKQENKEHKLKESLVLTGKAGDKTNIIAEEIPGYKLIADQYPGVQAHFSKENQTFNFFYELKNPIKIDSISDQTIRRLKNIDPVKISTTWDIQEIIVWEVKNGKFIPTLPEGLSYDKTTHTITGTARAHTGKYQIRVMVKSPHSTKDLNYDISTDFTLTITRNNNDSWNSWRFNNSTSEKQHDKKEKKSDPMEVVIAKKEEKTMTTGENIIYDNETIFNPTIENGKCYTRREYLGIKDSETLVTSEEFKKALSFLRSYEMTMFDSVEGFAPKRNLSREEAAKIFSNFAINVLCRKPDMSLSVKYSDVENANPTLKPYITLAYQLGVMKGSGMGDGKFRPKEYISKAEVNAVLIRMILKSYLDENKSENKVWYAEYNKVATDLGIINQGAGAEPVLRNNVALMLFRAYKNQVFDWRNVDYFSYVLESRDLFVK